MANRKRELAERPHPWAAIPGEIPQDLPAGFKRWNREIPFLRYEALLLCLILAFAKSHAFAQSRSDIELKALYDRATAYFQAKDYVKAVASREEWAKAVETTEAARGKARNQTADALGNVAWYALFAKQPQKALDAAVRALALAPGTLWIEANRAHALLFLRRTPEAINAYVDHKGETVPDHGKWEDVILKNFGEFRASGFDASKFTAVEKALAKAPDSPEVDNSTALDLLAKGKYTEALPLFERYAEAMKARYGENSARQPGFPNRCSSRACHVRNPYTRAVVATKPNTRLPLRQVWVIFANFVRDFSASAHSRAAEGNAATANRVSL